jgi:hypothetical protein
VENNSAYGRGPHVKSTMPKDRMPARLKRSIVSARNVMAISPSTSEVDRTVNHFSNRDPPRFKMFSPTVMEF